MFKLNPFIGMRKIVNWLLRDIHKDIRSVVVASVIGATVSYVATLMAETSAKEYIQEVNSDGYGRPLGLFETVENKGNVKLEFDPPNLKEVYVCEYTIVNGMSWRKVFLNYIDKYSICFYLAKQNESEFRVLPNMRSGALERSDSEFLCKC